MGWGGRRGGEVDEVGEEVWGVEEDEVGAEW